jgi:hypothetical protein
MHSLPRTLLASLCGVLLATLFLGGCQTTEPLVPPLGWEDVIALHESGASARTIGAAARNRGLGFPLDAQHLLALHDHGIPDATVQALLEAEQQHQMMAAEHRQPRVNVGLGLGFVGGHRGGWWYPHSRLYSHW